MSTYLKVYKMGDIVDIKVGICTRSSELFSLDFKYQSDSVHITKDRIIFKAVILIISLT
jgi:hypothetical protein